MKKLDLSVFPEVDKSSWEELAKNQLKGGDPNDLLSWQSFNGFSLDAYYDPSDLEELDYLKKFFQQLPNHRWKLYQEVSVINEKKANQKALEALTGGCDGIIFNLEKVPNTDELLQGINSEICDLSFINSIDNQFHSPNNFNGVTDENCLFEKQQHFSPIDQIEEFITLFEKGFIYRHAFPDFFLEIATLRALRYLLNTRLDKPGAQIHTHIPIHSQNDHQWFLNTTAGLASILGGSNSISFSTSKGDSRISRNVGNLIREESGIVEYSDQCGGAYYIEVLTHKLINETLKKLNNE